MIFDEGCHDRATEGTRTPDLLITNQLLYQLSYGGIVGNPTNNLRYLIKKSTLHQIYVCSKALEIKLKIFKHKISF